jgi:ribonucleoside-diphosphate reductase alpha chain
MEGQTAEDRIRQIANKAEEYLGIPGYADKFYDYMGRGFFSLASPIWSNYGVKRGLPVSCFGSYIEDNMESILYAHAENGMLMKGGGGTSGYFGELRHRGASITGNGESSGAVHFMKMFDTLASVVSQGSVRRGFFSAYLPIEHPDAEIGRAHV